MNFIGWCIDCSDSQNSAKLWSKKKNYIANKLQPSMTTIRRPFMISAEKITFPPWSCGQIDKVYYWVDSLEIDRHPAFYIYTRNIYNIHFKYNTYIEASACTGFCLGTSIQIISGTIGSYVLTSFFWDDVDMCKMNLNVLKIYMLYSVTILISSPPSPIFNKADFKGPWLVGCRGPRI